MMRLSGIEKFREGRPRQHAIAKKRNKYNFKCEVLYLKFYAESTFVGSKKKKSNVNDVVASFQSLFFLFISIGILLQL